VAKFLFVLTQACLDKNPDRLEEATAEFQEIQLAYSVLSDEAKRERYDGGDDDGGYDMYDMYDDDYDHSGHCHCAECVLQSKYTCAQCLIGTHVLF
jgi:hypothetical protein